MAVGSISNGEFGPHEAHPAGANFNGYTRTLAGVNGDGMDNIVYISDTAFSVILSSSTANRMHSMKNESDALVILGYTSSSIYQNTLLPFKLNPVSKITIDDGDGVLSTSGVGEF